MTNAEKIFQHILKYGKESVLIHTVPNTPFWLIGQKKIDTPPLWRIVLSDPNKTTWHLVSDHVTQKDYQELWWFLL